MFFPEGQIRVQLYGAPVDMRKSFDGLSALAEHAMVHYLRHRWEIRTANARL